MDSLTHQRVQSRCRTKKIFLAGSVGKNALSTKMAPCPVGPLRGSLTQRGKSFKYLGGGFERITSEKAFQRPCMLVLENIISYKPTHNRTRGSHRTTVGAVTCLDIFHTQHTGTLNRFFLGGEGRPLQTFKKKFPISGSQKGGPKVPPFFPIITKRTHNAPRSQKSYLRQRTQLL